MSLPLFILGVIFMLQYPIGYLFKEYVIVKKSELTFYEHKRNEELMINDTHVGFAIKHANGHGWVELQWFDKKGVPNTIVYDVYTRDMD